MIIHKEKLFSEYRIKGIRLLFSYFFFIFLHIRGVISSPEAVDTVIESNIYQFIFEIVVSTFYPEKKVNEHFLWMWEEIVSSYSLNNAYFLWLEPISGPVYQDRDQELGPVFIWFRFPGGLGNRKLCSED